MPADEIYQLGEDLSKAGARTTRALFDVYKQESEAFAEDWRRNAQSTSGKHARFYPRAITAEMKVSTSIVAEIGPEMSRKQGFLGRVLEFGGEKSPPHLDGAKAMAPAQTRLERAADAAIGFLLP